MCDSLLSIGVSCHLKQSTRNGTVIVLVAVLLVVLLGCVALAVDIGYLYVARTELQRAADAGALAGVQGLGRTLQSPFGEYLFAEKIFSQAKSLAEANSCAGKSVYVDRQRDIKAGYLSNPNDRNAVLQTVALDQCNTVQVTVRRDTSNPLGPIRLFFAPIFGIHYAAVSASAAAALDDRFYAYSPTTSGLGGIKAIPIGIHVDDWNDKIEVGNGSDQFGYDSYSDSVTKSPDGAAEISLYPGKTNAPGNFGILFMGTGKQGTSHIVDQIANGLTKEDLIDITGKPMIEFHDYDSGAAVNYDINGDPGIKAGLGDALHVGDKIGFFLYSQVVEGGSNSVFTIVGMRFGRIMKMDASAGNDGNTVIQPIPHYGPDILTSPNVPSTDRLIGTIKLVR